MSSTITSTIAARVPNETKAMITNALNLGNSTMKDVAIDFAKKIHSGELEVSNGKIIIPEPISENDDLDLSDFLEACDSKGIKPQDAINKAAQMVWRG